MNNLLSYCGLVDTRISASEKKLPVKQLSETIQTVYKDSHKEERYKKPFNNDPICHIFE